MKVTTAVAITDDHGHPALLIPHPELKKNPGPRRASAHREINSRKGDRLPHEAGLRLRKQPVAARVVPASALIRNHYSVRDWDHFLN